VSSIRVRALASYFLSQAGLDGADLGLLSIAFVDDEEMASINERFLKTRGPTDVISFHLPPPSGAFAGSGDVIINAAQAVREARRRRANPIRELAWYLAHGIHHLAGADDRTSSQRAAMHRIERRWLAAAARHGLLRGLVTFGL
jgi:rRNA maturation RNase YbeY